MRNQTIVKDLILLGLSNLPTLQLPLFLFFLLIYLLTFIWNSLIIFLVVTDSQLHVPMYFFLGNLAGLDLCFSSVTLPRMLFDLHTDRRRISIGACITQVFFFTIFGISDALLLAVMSYDRYTAICQPLHYTQIMSWKMCVLLMSIVWCLGFFSAFIHTFYVSKLTFCASNIIEGFFCDLPQLFLISCSDTFINVLLIFLVGGSVGVASLTLTFLSYVFIFTTTLKMKVIGNRSKVFSTCTSHLTVVSMYYGSAFLNYFQPSGGHHVQLAPVIFPVIVPLLNPLIYSLRNQDLRMTFQKCLQKIVHTLN